MFKISVEMFLHDGKMFVGNHLYGGKDFGRPPLSTLNRKLLENKHNDLSQCRTQLDLFLFSFRTESR